jgi:hypothetical protein
MKQSRQSPRIQRFSWGRLEIEGGKVYKDAKLFPGGSRQWDWRETGTAHDPGIQPRDVQELVENGAGVIVLATGVNGRLKVCSETLEMLKSKGISVQVLPTEEAIHVYNELSETEPVGGLFHSTC